MNTKPIFPHGYICHCEFIWLLQWGGEGGCDQTRRGEMDREGRGNGEREREVKKQDADFKRKGCGRENLRGNWLCIYPFNCSQKLIRCIFCRSDFKLVRREHELFPLNLIMMSENHCNTRCKLCKPFTLYPQQHTCQNVISIDRFAQIFRTRMSVQKQSKNRIKRFAFLLKHRGVSSSTLT